MIYLDTSALMKLVIEEPESIDLEHWLVLADGEITTNIVGRVELLRACRRIQPDSIVHALDLLAELPVLPLTPLTVGTAEQVRPPGLRTLDALHLASAIELGDDLTAFVVYDKRLRDAAALTDLPVVCPGVG